MACRKAAYRAQTRLSEWMHEQQEKADLKLAELESKVRKVWTPSTILVDCCLLWLHDGPEVLSVHGRGGSKGCSGGCGKDHPRITLDYTEKGGSVAEISHELDPFLNHFKRLESQRIAIADEKGNTRRFLLEGFLADHLEELSRSNVASHLVKVSPAALASSQRGHRRQLETEEEHREAKRRRLQQNVQAPDVLLLENALEVCWNQGTFLHHLDLVEISWMRLTCKLMAKFASRLARIRMSQVQLSYRCTLKNTEDDTTVLRERSPPFLRLRPPVPIDQPTTEVSTSTEGTMNRSLFVPAAQDVVPWTESAHFPVEMCISVFLEEPTQQEFICPEKDCLFSRPLEIAKLSVDPEEPVDDSRFQYLITCQRSVVPGNEGDDVTIGGTVTLQSFQLDFKDLLGVYVRRLLPIAKKRFQAIKAERPAKRLEKEYVKGLAKEARLAPGNADAFRGFEGWK